MNVLKLYLVTLIGLELVAFIIHFNELLNYIGSAFMAFMPSFIMIVAMIWLVRSIFKR